MNIKNKVLLFIIAILTGFSFTNMYNTYIELNLIEEISINQAPIASDPKSNISNYENLVLNEDAVIFLSVNDTNGLYIYYYNPMSNVKFNTIVSEYKQKCYKDCIEFVKTDLDVFASRITDIEIFSSEILTIDIYNKYNIEMNDMGFYEDDQKDETSSLRLHYQTSLVTIMLAIFTLVCLLTTELTNNMKKMNLYSIYGFSFKTLIKDWNKKYLRYYLIIYLVLFNAICLFTIKNLYFLKLGLIYNLFVITITYLIFLVTSYYFYRKIRKEYQFKFLKRSTNLLGTILAILTALSIYFINDTINFYKISNDVDDAFNVNSNYYSLAYDLSIDEKVSSYAAQDLIEDYGGIYRSFNDFGTESTPILESDDSIFSQNGLIYDVNDIAISYDESRNVLYYVDEENLVNLNSYESYDKIQIKDNGKDYETLSPFTATVKLKDVVLVVYDHESLYVSNVYIKAQSKNEAEEIFEEVYEKYNIQSDVSVVELGQTQFKDQANKTYFENAVAAAIAGVSIIIANIFYTSLIFQGNKDKIIISNILGQRYYNRISCVVKEFLYVWILTLIIMIVIRVYAINIYLLVIIIQYVTMDLYIRFLTKNSLAQNLKEEI